MRNDSSTAKTACVHCFKSLGVPAKYEIYSYLTNNTEATVSQLVELVGLSQPTVSYHLKDMHQSGLLSSKKVGKKVYYSLDTSCPHSAEKCVLSQLQFQK